MADISVEQKSGGQQTWIWAALAVVAVAALMIWLGSQPRAASNDMAAVEGDTAAAAAGGAQQGAAGGAEAAELSAIGANPDQFAGRTVQVSGVSVAATVGPRAFWADIPGANPFLVVLAPEVADPGVASVGSTLNMRGTVEAVNDQVLGEWIQQGVIAEGARDEASFATHYLRAVQAGQ